MSLLSDEQLDWLAFQYVTDELDEKARCQFEQRLENDLDACEALARAVQMTQTLAAAEQQVVLADRQFGRLRRIAWSAAAVAACLALIMAFQWISTSTTPVGPQTVDHDQASESNLEVALAWIHTITTQPAFDSDADSVMEQDDSDADLAGMDESLDDFRTAAPGWMLAAVSGLDLDGSASEILDASPAVEN